MIKEKFIYFPPNRIQYIFSENLLKFKYENKLMYTPYSLKAKIVWKVLLIFPQIKRFLRIKENSIPLYIRDFIEQKNSKNTTFQINLGTQGPDQKTTILIEDGGNSSFYKIGTTQKSHELIKNEYNTLNMLQGRLNSPLALSFIVDKEIFFLETELFVGEKLKSLSLSDRIFNQILKISNLQPPSVIDEITYTFSHGDFCPWNILVHKNSELQTIDWEMSAEYPLAFDLFTFIFQTSFLLKQHLINQEIINLNKKWIKIYFDYFKEDNIKKYLKKFTEIKIDLETKKDEDSFLLQRYTILKNEINTLEL